MAVDDVLKQLASMKQEYNNSPVYVVPDELMPTTGVQTAQAQSRVKYGEEVPRQTWQEMLDNLVRSIQMHQQLNPPYVPFAPGTPTLEKQKFDWLKTVQEAELTETYKGKPIASTKTTTETKNSRTAGYMQVYKNRIDEAWGRGGWKAAADKLPEIVAEIYAIAPQMKAEGVDPQEIIDYVYQLVGGFVKEGGTWKLSSDASTTGTQQGLLSSK